MIRQILSTARQRLAEYANVSRRMIALEAENVLLQQQRDQLAAMVQELNDRLNHGDGDAVPVLKRALARMGIAVDGAGASSLASVVTNKLQEFEAREAEAIDIGDRAGFHRGSSPQLVSDLVAWGREQTARANELESTMAALVNWRNRVQSEIDWLDSRYTSKKSIRPSVRKLRELVRADLKDFEPDEKSTKNVIRLDADHTEIGRTKPEG